MRRIENTNIVRIAITTKKNNIENKNVYFSVQMNQSVNYFCERSTIFLIEFFGINLILLAISTRSYKNLQMKYSKE